MPGLSDFAGDVERAFVRGMADAEQSIYWRAYGMSSGPYSLGDLARMDHPFATRHGTALLDPATINVQSGRFREDWEALPLIIQRSAIHMLVVNRNPVADYLKYGTRTMLPRPIEEAVEADAERLIVAAIEAELALTLSQTYS